MVDGAAPPSTRPLLDLVESRGLNSPPSRRINSHGGGRTTLGWIRNITTFLGSTRLTLKRCFSGPHDPLLTNS